MRVHPFLTIAGLTLALLSVAPARGAEPAAGASAASAPGSGSAAPSLIEQGHYVALTADCQSCHTAPGAKPFSGGAALKTPFGSIYPPNITPDAKTGTGNWTEADFTRALRQGVRKDGSALYPAMPYDSYTRMSDADIAALWAYMRSVPAVSHATPGNTFPFPLNLRAGMAVWQAAFFKPGRYEPAADKSAEWNRGAYLVEGPGHCSACHTPRNIAQASELKRNLTGAEIQGWYAPNISNDPLSKLNGVDVDELAGFLKTGRQRGNVKTFGLMQEVVHDSLQHLKDVDLHAMAVYLKDQPGDAKASHVASKAAPAQLAAGKALYETHCASCHQADGQGIRGSVPALAGNGAITASQPYNVVMAMLQGFEPQGNWAAMASFADTLSDAQIADVANYVRASWGNRAEHEATLASVGSLRSVAQVPAAGTNNAALVCPVLAPALLQPALKPGPAALKRAARDADQLATLVKGYRAARPRASVAEVVEALSTAYCRALAADGASTARAGAGMAEFSRQVATLMWVSGSPPDAPQRRE